MSFRIRPFNRNDAAALIDVFEQSIRGLAVRDYTPAQIEAWIPKSLSSLNWASHFATHPTFVAEQGSEILGFSDLCETEDALIRHLDMMYIVPTAKGQGIAQALYDRVEREAYNVQAALITVEASLTARKFFEKQGFVIVKAQEVEREKQRLRNYHMEKKL